jgi:pantetheine-phosphate adenylyltransferase
MATKFNHIVIGGTFDLLHAGHKKFIDTAFDLAEFVSIGLTTDSFNTKRGKETYQNQDERQKALVQHLERQSVANRSEIILIDDIFGTSLDAKIDAIIATSDTQINAEIINKRRDELGLEKLEIVHLERVKDTSGKIISSTRIRNGEIDLEGRIYKELLLHIADRQLNFEIIAKLKSPLGVLGLKITKTQNPIISVGDTITKDCLKNNIVPFVSIIDFKTHREKIYNTIREIGFEKEKADFFVINKSGEISKELIDVIEKSIHADKNTEQIILVEGEEDLAVIPAVLLSPYRTTVVYGQPNEGIVEILVNEESKSKICKILNLS